MPKLVLGKTPKTFKPFLVKYQLPDGTDDQILITFRYKTRKEFAQFLNTLFAASGQAPTAEPDQLDFEALYAQASDKTVSQLTQIIDGWDFAEPVTAATLAQLHDQVPAAAAAMTAAYAAACNEGRLGN